MDWWRKFFFLSLTSTEVLSVMVPGCHSQGCLGYLLGSRFTGHLPHTCLFMMGLTVTGSYLILGTRVVLRASSMFIKVQLTRRIVFFQLLYSFGLYTEVKRSTEKITLRNSLSIVTFTA